MYQINGSSYDKRVDAMHKSYVYGLMSGGTIL